MFIELQHTHTHTHQKLKINKKYRLHTHAETAQAAFARSMRDKEFFMQPEMQVYVGGGGLKEGQIQILHNVPGPLGGCGRQRKLYRSRSDA